MSDSKQLACPHCLSTEHLGENVVGWRGPLRARRVGSMLVVEMVDMKTYDVQRESFFCSNVGCDVDREIRTDQLVPVKAASGREADRG